jgi:hypothetical protein
MPRTRLLLLVGVALLVAALAVPAIGAISAAPPTNNGFQNRGFTTQQRNHFGSPAFGYVVAEEWAHLDTAAPGEGNVQGCSRWFVVFNALRVQINAVNVRDADTGAVLMSTTGPKNSSGAPSVQLCTPAFPQPGNYYVEVNAAIRWADNTLSQNVSFGSTINL